jgi:hypothetical protein
MTSLSQTQLTIDLTAPLCGRAQASKRSSAVAGTIFLLVLVASLLWTFSQAVGVLLTIT